MVGIGQGYGKAWRLVAGLLPPLTIGRAAWVLSVAASFFVAAVDPFDLGTRSETAADAAVQRIDGHARPRLAADAIVLVMLTRQALADPRFDLHYPLSYGSQAMLIQVAAASGARAIFLDFDYIRNARDPAGMRALADAVAGAKAMGIAVLTGPIAHDRPDLAPLAAVARQTGVWLDRPHPADYPLATTRPDGNTMPTAAPDLFQLACRAQPSRFAGCRQPIGKIDGPPVAIRFGGIDLRGSEGFIDPLEIDRCHDGDAWRSFRDALLGAATSAPCPRYLTIPAEFSLFRPDAAVQAGLRDRLVLIGVGPGMGDDKVVPGIGTVPGVVLHAAALDNLLSWGARHPAWPADLPHLWKIGPDELLKLATIIVLPPLAAIFAGCLLRRRNDRGITRWQGAARMIAVLIGLGGSLVLLALLGWVLLNWPVAMAVLVAAMSTVTLGLASSHAAGELLSPLNHPAIAWAMLLIAAAVAAGIAWGTIAALALVIVSLVALAIAGLAISGRGTDRPAAASDLEQGVVEQER